MVELSGTTEWMNPYGYLDGTLYGSLGYSAFMSMCYLGLASAWFILCLCYWRELQGVQNWITVVLAIAMIEASIKYFELANWNETGKRSLGYLSALIFFATLKDAMARFLLLVVSMGYGIVKPSLGSTLYRALTLAGVYYAACFSQRMVEEMSHGLPSSVLMYLLLLPVSIANVGFLFIMFESPGNN